MAFRKTALWAVMAATALNSSVVMAQEAGEGTAADNANKREDRAPHKYALEDFGLVRSDVEQRFAAYRAAFLEGK
jgi:hypothetical protein